MCLASASGAWASETRHVGYISGCSTTKTTHLEDAVGALSVELTEEDVAYLEEPYVPHLIVGHE
jgi:aryl-alcohol dehydrogenase-like predicted oxidoreductase